MTLPLLAAPDPLGNADLAPNHRPQAFASRMLAVSVVVASIASPGPATAQGSDAASLAKAAQNPIADMISLPFQYNVNFDAGPLEKTQHLLNIQPVYPIN